MVTNLVTLVAEREQPAACSNSKRGGAADQTRDVDVLEIRLGVPDRQIPPADAVRQRTQEGYRSVQHSRPLP